MSRPYPRGAKEPGCTLRAAIALAALLVAPLGWIGACSLQNQLGPDVTCADLQCGRINACEEGIIAQCADGLTVRYHVCAADDDELCEQSWQMPGQYRCDEYGTDCEGCNPTAAGCPAPDGGVGGTAGSAGAGASAGAGGAGGGGA